jgi:MerR family transcriptional regulator, redox-sensitive transcriptional activator SoxR
MSNELLSIGDVEQRTGVSASALRYYENEGFIRATRSNGGQRRFHRDELRRIAFIRVAQSVGLSLEEIRSELSKLPDQRTPTKSDWEKLSSAWKPRLDEQIAVLQRLRDDLSSCIGCGCLSLKACKLYNPEDVAALGGMGARYLLGDKPPTEYP